MNFEIIKSISDGEARYLSTSQRCMCAIALCRPSLLEEERITPSQAWQRIDAEQLDAILEFTGAKAKFAA